MTVDFWACAVVSLFSDDLRGNEAAKMDCGAAHFAALAIDKNPARYVKATKVDDLMGHVGWLRSHRSHRMP